MSRPSLKTLLGVTRAKKQIKKDLGSVALLKPLRWWPNHIWLGGHIDENQNEPK
jgi:hypothetical protein